MNIRELINLIDEKSIIQEATKEDLSKSFAALVKNNGGIFKSEKQAKFLLSQCQQENTFITSGNMYRNPYTLVYFCDSNGVTKVMKDTTKKHNVVVWQRTENSQRDSFTRQISTATNQIEGGLRHIKETNENFDPLIQETEAEITSLQRKIKEAPTILEPEDAEEYMQMCKNRMEKYILELERLKRNKEEALNLGRAYIEKAQNTIPVLQDKLAELENQ